MEETKTEETGFTITEIVEIIRAFTPPIYLKYDAIRMYSMEKLAPSPLIEGGKGKGNKTLFPPATTAEVAASYRLIKK